MTKDEGMTKLEGRDACTDDSFWDEGTGLVREDFLRMIVRAAPELKPQARTLWLEAKELHLIFSKIWRNK
jgi:hypothetical protein